MKSHSITLRREAGHGGFVPRGWHMAWYEPRRRVGVYYPAPLHWMLRALRELAYRWRIALHAPSLEHLEVFELQRSFAQRQKFADEYARGYLVGWRECYQTCLDAVEDEMTRTDEAWDLGSILTETPKLPRKN